MFDEVVAVILFAIVLLVGSLIVYLTYKGFDKRVAAVREDPTRAMGTSTISKTKKKKRRH